MKTILLISPYWKEEHRWMASSLKFAELWQRLGYRVVAVCMAKKAGVERVSNTLTIYRKKDFFLPDPFNFGIAPGFTWFVHGIIRKERPDLIVCNKILFWSSFSTIVLRLLGYRVLVLTDAFVGMTWWPRGIFPKIVMAIGGWTMGWLVLLCARRVVTFHPQPAGLLRKLGIFGKTRVIPTGIDASRFKPHEHHAHEVVTVTYVGRLESVKGVDDYLAAIVPLKALYPRLTVQVVGWYKDGHPLVRQYQRDVIFTGLRDDIPAILSDTDIFVMPSYSEGLSNAIMEAMASSCACVVSDVGGNRFLIENGVSGLRFAAGDRAALAAHVRRLLDDPAKRAALGKAARKRIDDVFDWTRVGEEYRKLFEE